MVEGLASMSSSRIWLFCVSLEAGATSLVDPRYVYYLLGSRFVTKQSGLSLGRSQCRIARQRGQIWQHIETGHFYLNRKWSFGV